MCIRDRAEDLVGVDRHVRRDPVKQGGPDEEDVYKRQILGRALQGGGAVSAAVMALAADLTREEHRIKVMATIGITIGLSFAISMIMGPVLNGWIGVPGIFWLTGLCALLSLSLIHI